MFGDETAEKSSIKYDGFTVDFLKDGIIRLGENEFKLGHFGCDICNISKKQRANFLFFGILSNDYNLKLNKKIMRYSSLFTDIKKLVNTTASVVKRVKPFIFFDFTDIVIVSNDVFSEWVETNIIDMSEHIEKTGEILDYNLMGLINRKIHLGKSMLEKQSFFCKGVACFALLMKKFIDFIVEEDCHTKDELVLCAKKFISSQEGMAIIKESNFDYEYADSTFHSRVNSIPIIVNDSKSNKQYVARRMYFNNIVDFLLIEWIEGMAQGHYIWKCKICGKYFLITSPNHRDCCDGFNEEYNTKCENVTTELIVAKRNELYRHKRKNNPLWHTRNLRCNTIRKNKKLGKYSEAVSDEARKVLDERYYLAEKDEFYADFHFGQDVILENIYEEAIKRLK
ncbi:MAG: DUF6076 domain-containing protein [Clostridia bacterium]